jgi:putative Mg2+ transporter-C (MgtC) family protein
MEWQEQARILGQVALAMALAAIIGIDRELAHKPAGLRTHMLVSGAAALLVGLGFTIVRRFGGSSQYPLVRVDPVVVIQAVVTAVGFLGAGTILHAGGGGGGGGRTTSGSASSDALVHIEGLTTAASLLFVAALGTCVALGQTLLALGVTALAWVTLRLIAALEERFRRRGAARPVDRGAPPSA